MVPSLHPCVYPHLLTCIITMPFLSGCAYFSPLSEPHHVTNWDVNRCYSGRNLKKLLHNWAAVLLHLLSSWEGHALTDPLEKKIHMKQSQDIAGSPVSQTKTSYSQPTPRHLGKSNQGQHLTNPSCSVLWAINIYCCMSLRFFSSGNR